MPGGDGTGRLGLGKNCNEVAKATSRGGFGHGRRRGRRRGRGFRRRNRTI